MTTYPTILGFNGHKSQGAYPASTRYASIGLGRCVMESTRYPGGITNEAYTSQTVRVAGTVSRLSWGLDTAFDGSLTLKLRQNSADTNLKVKFDALVTGWMTDTSHAVDVAVEDWIDLVCYIGDNDDLNYPGSFNCASARFDASASGLIGSAQMIVAFGAGYLNPSATLQYGNFLGILSFQDSTLEQFNALTSGTWQNMACYVESNELGSNTTAANNIASGTTSMAIVIPGGTLGVGSFEDTTHSDSVVAGSIINYTFDSSASLGAPPSDQLVMPWIGCHYLPSPATHCMIGGMPDAFVFGVITPSSPTQYSSLFGGGNISNDLTRATGKFPYPGTVLKFANYLSDAGANGAATFTLLVSGSPALAVSSGLGHSGWFIDNATSPVSFSNSDTCTNQVVWSGVTGAHDTVSWCGAGLLVSA